MAELFIQWADGRTEVRSLLPAQVTTVGDSRAPMVHEIPIGKTLSVGGRRLPFCLVRLHGDEIPFMMLRTAGSPTPLVLESALKVRKRLGAK